MTLALRLGKTLKELIQDLDASELRMWMAYDKISPIGDGRGDIQTAMIASAVMNAAGAKVSLRDMILVWDQEADNEPVSDGNNQEPLEAWLSSMSE
ncbi:TPA: phage tail assembly protein T [Providencia alcalifaciens]